jgi:hypothetical protein
MLTLVFALCISHWLAVFDEGGYSVTYKFESAAMALWNAGNIHHYLDSDVIDQIPPGESLVSELPENVRDDMWFKSFAPANYTDSWRNPYRVVSEQRDGLRWLGFFSTGADGVSESKGNDPDDINSWGQDGYDHYIKVISLHARNRYIEEVTWIFLWVAPVCGLIYELAARRSASRKRQPANKMLR